MNANVAFLDLPGISPSQADEGDVSPSLSIAQSASQLSMVTSIGSMIIGLLLVRQHRTKPIDTAHDAVRNIIFCFERRLNGTFMLGELP